MLVCNTVLIMDRAPISFLRNDTMCTTKLHVVYVCFKRIFCPWILPGLITTSHAIVARYSDKIIPMKKLCTHTDIIVKTEIKATVLVIRF